LGHLTFGLFFFGFFAFGLFEFFFLDLDFSQPRLDHLRDLVQSDLRASNEVGLVLGFAVDDVTDGG
jgi:hypothetical protein